MAEAGYVGGPANPVVTVAAGAQGSGVGTAGFSVLPRERQVSLRLEDSTGLPVAADVLGIVDERTGEHVLLGELCSGGPTTFALPRRTTTVSVRPRVTGCNGAASTATSGRVFARFR